MTPDEIRALIDIPVRPEADAFPMLDPDAFDDLVEGIRVNGQLEPVELDADGAIGDGRNRYAVCRRLGIAPRTVTLPADTDWFSRVVERNLNRRHATPGARAVGLMKAALASHNGSHRTNLRGTARRAGISHASLSRALFLIEHAVDLADQVEHGASLLAAYNEAVGRDARRVDEETRRMARLEQIDRERAALVAAIVQAHYEVGEAVAIPPEPDLEIVLPKPEAGDAPLIDGGGADVEILKQQEAMLRAMNDVKRRIRALADGPAPSDPKYLEGHVLAVRSWSSQMVAMIYGIVEAYNAALSGAEQIRRVK